MNIIKVKDFNSMQAITVGLARNGYMVTADSITDENYKEHWEIKYCEVSEVEEKSNDSDFNNDFNPDPRDKTSDVPIINRETSDNITDEQMTVITSISGN